MQRRSAFTSIRHGIEQHPRHGSAPPRRGAILPMFALFVPIILVLGAFAINVAWMSLVDTELQICSDTAARAAGREFSITQNLTSAFNRGVQAGAMNKVGGRTLTLTTSELKFGESTLNTSGPNAGTYGFTPKTVTQATLGSFPGQVYINAVDVRLSQHFGFSEMPLPIPLLSASNGFTPRAGATSSQFERDIALVLDRSGSMNEYSSNWAGWSPAGPGEAYYGSRWRELVDAVRTFNALLDASPFNESIGLSTFSTTASLDLPLQSTSATIEANLDAITTNFAGGMTAIGDGIGVGISILNDPGLTRSAAKKTIIVMTDGIYNKGVEPVFMAQQAHDIYGITVHAISFSNDADIARMESVAAAGGGAHYHAVDSAQLNAAFIEIAKSLPTILTR